MNLNLNRYNKASILASYEHFLFQHLSGMMAPEEQLNLVSTPQIYGKVCCEMRSYFGSGITPEDYASVEEKTIELVLYAAKSDQYEYLKQLVDNIRWESKLN